jgi:hypothetical protein
VAHVIHVYQTPQGKNRKICEAFAAGSGGKIVPPYPLQPDGDVFMFGILRGVLPTLWRAQAEGRAYYFGDNGYFRPAKRLSSGGYIRVTRNAFQHDGAGEAGPERWQRLKLTIQPWRTTGSHIVVCPPARLWSIACRIDADQWLKDTLATLKQHTDRPLRVRKKMSYKEATAPGGVPLPEDLKDAWALATYSSNAAVEALLAGVPVFCTAPCAAYRMGSPDLTTIETPQMLDDRERWVCVLADNQWTLDELSTGTAWQALTAVETSDLAAAG